MALTETLKDNFNDNSLDTSKWDDFGSVSETSKQLAITLTGASPAYHGIYSLVNYDLTGSYISVMVVNAGNQTWASIEVELQLIKDADNRLFMLIANGNLMAYREVAGVTSSLAGIAYDSSTMRYLRIREASGTVYWDYSADNVTWTNLFSQAAPMAVTSMQQEIDAGNWDTESGTTTIIFDNFNIDAAGLVHYRDKSSMGTEKSAPRVTNGNNSKPLMSGRGRYYG